MRTIQKTWASSVCSLAMMAIFASSVFASDCNPFKALQQNAKVRIQDHLAATRYLEEFPFVILQKEIEGKPRWLVLVPNENLDTAQRADLEKKFLAFFQVKGGTKSTLHQTWGGKLNQGYRNLFTLIKKPLVFLSRPFSAKISKLKARLAQFRQSRSKTAPPPNKMVQNVAKAQLPPTLEEPVLVAADPTPVKSQTVQEPQSEAKTLKAAAEVPGKITVLEKLANDNALASKTETELQNTVFEFRHPYAPSLTFSLTGAQILEVLKRWKTGQYPKSDFQTVLNQLEKGHTPKLAENLASLFRARGVIICTTLLCLKLLDVDLPGEFLKPALIGLSFYRQLGPKAARRIQNRKLAKFLDPLVVVEEATNETRIQNIEKQFKENPELEDFVVISTDFEILKDDLIKKGFQLVDQEKLAAYEKEKPAIEAKSEVQEVEGKTAIELPTTTNPANPETKSQTLPIPEEAGSTRE